MSFSGSTPLNSPAEFSAISLTPPDSATFGSFGVSGGIAYVSQISNYNNSGFLFVSATSGPQTDNCYVACEIPGSTPTYDVYASFSVGFGLDATHFVCVRPGTFVGGNVTSVNVIINNGSASYATTNVSIASAFYNWDGALPLSIAASLSGTNLSVYLRVGVQPWSLATPIPIDISATVSAATLLTWVACVRGYYAGTNPFTSTYIDKMYWGPTTDLTALYTSPSPLSGIANTNLTGALSWSPVSKVGTAPTAVYHFDDGAGSTAFTDSSGNGLNLVAAHGAAETNVAPKFGVGCFSPSGGLATAAAGRVIVANDLLDLTNVASWTIEGWIKPPNLFGSYILSLSLRHGGTPNAGVEISFDVSGNLALGVFGPTSGPGGVPTVGGAVAGAWNHFAAVKAPNVGGPAGDRYQVFLNGVGGGWSNAGVPFVGPYASWATGHLDMCGYYDAAFGDYAQSASSIDEVCITRDVAKYLANFPPPTAPFPNSGTVPGYDVQRDGVSIATFLGPPGYVDTVPAPGPYTYQVSAWDGTTDVGTASNLLTLTYASSTTIPVYGKFAIAGAFKPSVIVDAKGLGPRIYRPKENMTVKA